ncbi:hypothetical protein H9P43_000813 [Blastocladiella emersonii ATCC 22665]|nr:hypothetical protein H9P43_000813 [Blastocladiella emersonii ATCC 22665]
MAPPPPVAAAGSSLNHSGSTTGPFASGAAAAGSTDSYSGTPRSPGSNGLLTDEELTDLFRWVDGIPLSRPKRNFTRDFSDGCMVAEIIRQVNPRLVELHNYPPANSTAQKVYNWNTLSFKVLRKLGCALTDDTIQQIVQCKPGIVETVLFDIKQKLLHSVAGTAGSKRSMAMAQGPLDPQQQQQQQQGMLGGSGLRRGRGSFSQGSLGSNGAQDGGGPVLHAHPSDPGAMSDREKDQMIATLRDTVGILQEKIHKLELLLVLKDKKIAELSQ